MASITTGFAAHGGPNDQCYDHAGRKEVNHLRLLAVGVLLLNQEVLLLDEP